VASSSVALCSWTYGAERAPIRSARGARRPFPNGTEVMEPTLYLLQIQPVRNGDIGVEFAVGIFVQALLQPSDALRSLSITSRPF